MVCQVQLTRVDTYLFIKLAPLVIFLAVLVIERCPAPVRGAWVACVEFYTPSYFKVSSSTLPGVETMLNKDE